MSILVRKIDATHWRIVVGSGHSVLLGGDEMAELRQKMKTLGPLRFRSDEEVQALRERVLARVQKGETHSQIADDEEISTAYVASITMGRRSTGRTKLRRVWGAAELADLTKNAAGKTLEQIARHYGCGMATIEYALRAHDIPFVRLRRGRKRKVVTYENGAGL